MVDAAQSSLQIELPPSAEGVTTAMSVVIEAIRCAHHDVFEQSETVKAQCCRLDEERRRYADDREEFDGLREDVESKLIGLAESTKKVEQLAVANEATRVEVAQENARAARRVEELDLRERNITDANLKQKESAKCLAVKEEKLARARQACDDERKQLEPQRKEIRRQKEGLEERSEKLDAYAEELAGSRTALETMQHQLGRDQEEIATQRQSLLSKIGGAIQSPDAPEAKQQKKAARSEPTAAPKARGPGPKTGGGSSAGQFRKLRRDAKRKSIGL